MPRPVSDWITLNEAAEIFATANIQISTSTLRRWASTGRLQSIRPGRRIFVRRAQVRSMLRPRGRRARPGQPADGGPVPGPGGLTGRASAIEGLVRAQRERLERLAQPLLRRRLVVELRQAWADFGASGGSIVAAGLAYRTMFATLTLLVFAAGLAGIVISDPARRVDVINALVTVLPGPLHDSLTASVDALGREGLTVGLVGLVGLFWGASSMYEALDQATSMILPGGRRRGGLDRRVRGLVAVAALTVVVGAFLALTPLVAAGFVDLGVGVLLATVIEPLGGIVAFVALVYAGYRFVPTAPPERPGRPCRRRLVAGTAMSILTTFFAVLAPFLVSRMQAFGVVASFLAALIWLDLLGCASSSVGPGPAPDATSGEGQRPIADLELSPTVTMVLETGRLSARALPRPDSVTHSERSTLEADRLRVRGLPRPGFVR